ncbi:MAG: glycerol-3-phosphate 1-O-acyltransferase PlsY [Thermoanaerobaculia bacterium]
MSFLPLALIVVSYLLGSIPFSFIIVWILERDDIRLHGSGNVGATNVMRNFGRLPGAIALVLDIAKGWVAVEVARMVTVQTEWPWRYSGAASDWMHAPSFWIGLAALVAVLGHMYPVWLGYRGGKGVATATGVFLAMQPAVIAVAAVVFVITLIATRYVSLSSIVAAVAVPVLLRFFTGSTFWIVLFSILISVIIVIRHRANIARIVNGEERKFPR